MKGSDLFLLLYLALVILGLLVECFLNVDVLHACHDDLLLLLLLNIKMGVIILQVF